MPPIYFLLILCAATVVALVIQLVRRRSRISDLRRLAQEWQMHYTPGDRFRLGLRVAHALDVPGAAAVRIVDIIYGTEGASYRYYFTTHYTTGVLKRKIDHAAVATTTEPKERSVCGGLELRLAPAHLSIAEQYRHLHGDKD